MASRRNAEQRSEMHTCFSLPSNLNVHHGPTGATSSDFVLVLVLHREGLCKVTSRGVHIFGREQEPWLLATSHRRATSTIK